MKYRPQFPNRFGCFEDGRSFCSEFFHWYNQEHHHSGLGYLTPHEVHSGVAQQRRQERASVLRTAFEKNPERFVHGLPTPPALPEQAWINQPKEVAASNENEATSAENLLVPGVSQKNGFHICPVSNEQESGRDL